MYACLWVVFGETKGATETQLVEKARQEISSVSLNGYEHYETMIIRGGSEDVLNLVKAKYQLSDYQGFYYDFY